MFLFGWFMSVITTYQDNVKVKAILVLNERSSYVYNVTMKTSTNKSCICSLLLPSLTDDKRVCAKELFLGYNVL